MSANGVFKIRQGDRLPSLSATATRKDLITTSNPTGLVDFTGKTIAFRMVGPITVTGVGAGTIAGILTYAWGATDTLTPGAYSAVFVATASGLEQTYPTDGEIQIEIVADI
jgi:hypothetical protein